MSDDTREQEERERIEKLRKQTEEGLPSITPNGGVSLPIGGGLGIDITNGHPTISIGPGLSIDL